MLAFVLPGMGIAGAAVVYANPITEQLVEGHTVFAVIEVTSDSQSESEEYAAAVAVLVRDYHQKQVAKRFPGVLWFNDQYLTEPTSRQTGDPIIRYPCSGAVIATNNADPAPPLNDPLYYNVGSYVESYFITDPNDHSWNVDKWLINGSLVWSVALRGTDTTYSTPDDGTSNCAAYTDNGGSRNYAPSRLGPYAENPGANGYNYPCGGQGTGTCTNPLRYNAVLYFLLADLTVPGADKDHTEGSADWSDDVSGCQVGTDPSFAQQWPCPAADDNREGNSHPYNPENGYPINRYSGEGNHGGSADCKAGAGTYDDYDCHATRNIDIYYGVAAFVARTYRVSDFEGSQAAYHCHSGINCGPDPYAGMTSS